MPVFTKLFSLMTGSMSRDGKLRANAGRPDGAHEYVAAANCRTGACLAVIHGNATIKAGELPPVGNYNLFWTDRGMSVQVIDGEKRTSMIIDPPNGRVPPLTAAAQQRGGVRRAARSGAADGPEQRGLGERCLLSFGSSGGPPMLPTMYNSYYQIVYRFTIEDPSTFTSSFTGELAFTPANGNIYEYACHEGNYALPGILAAEREQEKIAAGKNQ